MTKALDHAKLGQQPAGDPVSALDFLKKRRSELSAEIGAMNVELSQLDAAINALVTFSDICGVRPVRVVMGAGRPMTIDKAIEIAVWEGRRRPAAILEYLESEMGISTTINSVRTRTSRLKSAGRLVLGQAGWQIP